MRYIDLKVVSSDIIHLKGLNLNPVPITSGSVNDIFCRFKFSHHWDDFPLKTAVFTGSGQSRSVIIEDGQAVIPWECITLPGGELRVGIVGTVNIDGENGRIFTSEEICLGTIVYGADIDAEPSGEPSPGVAEQLLLKFDSIEKSESTRVINETQRQENEQVRIANEQAREQTVTDISGKLSELEEKIENTPVVFEGVAGNVVSFGENGQLDDSNIAAKDIVQKESFVNHLNNTVTNKSGTHGIRVFNGALQVLNGTTWSNYVCPSDHSDPIPSDKIDSVFANNSWEDIALVARYKDPSKYWKVGDYKEIDMPMYNISIGEKKDVNFFNRDNFLVATDFEEGMYNVSFIEDESGMLVAKITGNDFEFIDSQNTLEFDFVKTFDEDTGKYKTEAFITDLTVSKIIRKVPAQIIGFNHDNVAVPISYGKSKAGITFMLGCTKSVYGNKVGVYDDNIPYCSVSMDDNHIISPNSLDANKKITDIGSNWSTSAFKGLLANHLALFLPEEIVKNIVYVHKLTSNLFSVKNFHHDYRVTTERFFLLSEYEIYGEQILTKAIEGEQYQFFKNGYSKIIMTPEILDAVEGNSYKTHTSSRFWLRSVDSSFTDPYIPSGDFYSPTSKYTSNPNYANNGLNKRTNSLLVSYNQDTEIYNYQPGTAYSNSTPAYIAPCFCL